MSFVSEHGKYFAMLWQFSVTLQTEILLTGTSDFLKKTTTTKKRILKSFDSMFYSVFGSTGEGACYGFVPCEYHYKNRTKMTRLNGHLSYCINTMEQLFKTYYLFTEVIVVSTINIRRLIFRISHV